MRILLIGYLYGRGGIQNHTHWLAVGLKELGHEPEVFTPLPIHGHSSDFLYPVDYPVFTYPNRSALLQLIPSTSSRSFDVAVVCGTGWKAMLTVLLNRRIRKRVFFEVMSGERSRFFDPRMLTKLGFDAVVGQASEVEQRFCEEFKWQGKRITIPALPDPLEKYCSIPNLDLMQPGGIRAAYFGRLAKHKGVHFLIENWHSISDELKSLDIYGTGDEEPKLKQLVAEHGLQDRIYFHGAYPTGEEYVRLIQQHQLVLLPTTGAEGAPLVLLESMACGVPFVANGVGGIPSYANNNCSTTSGNISEFIPLLKKMCERLKSGTIDSRGLQDHYKNFFSFNALTHKWNEFLTQL